MKRKKIITLLAVFFLAITVGCESDDDMLTSKQILSETLTQGKWQVSLNHSPSANTLDFVDVELTFSNDFKVFALTKDGSTGMDIIQNGAYALVYDDTDERDPDEDLEYYYERDRKKDLYLSMAFSMNEHIIFNHRWKVKTFTSTSVKLKANDVILVLNKN
ncbi:hypothetical protein [Carboxylicivirga marina]|uniref:Lipocalin-like domain-containing protein n=1 Tax=Carboxylicivirga marina TaxID=2800988 RepID=A0ABS1HP03_9BACT|nr:hypothetical protein [Carboxylicivirga marina]MBK3519429.1 hypothetical protein [Carboxylicivirga marina]